MWNGLHDHCGATFSTAIGIALRHPCLVWRDIRCLYCSSNRQVVIYMNSIARVKDKWRMVALCARHAIAKLQLIKIIELSC